MALMFSTIVSYTQASPAESVTEEGIVIIPTTRLESAVFTNTKGVIVDVFLIPIVRGGLTGSVRDQLGNPFPAATRLESLETVTKGITGTVDFLPFRGTVDITGGFEIVDIEARDNSFQITAIPLSSEIFFETVSVSLFIQSDQTTEVSLIVDTRGFGNSMIGGMDIGVSNVHVAAFLRDELIAETISTEEGVYSFADLTVREETVELVFSKEGFETRKAVVDLDNDRAQVLPVEMSTAKSILASSIVCVVQDGDTREKYLDATLSLNPSVLPSIIGSELGVYIFEGLDSGTYTVTAAVPGLPNGSRTVTLSPGGLATLTISTGKHLDHIGGGTLKNPPGCSVGHTASTNLWGDFAVIVAALVVLVESGRRRTVGTSVETARAD